MKLSITEIISITVFALSVVSTILSVIISKTKSKSKLEDYKSETDRSKKTISLISEIIPSAIKFAEKSGNNGVNKKLLALSKILIECMNSGIDYTGLSDTIDETIEKFVAFSKEVNVVTVNKEV